MSRLADAVCAITRRAINGSVTGTATTIDGPGVAAIVRIVSLTISLGVI